MIISDYPVSTIVTVAASEYETTEESLLSITTIVETLLAMDEVIGKFVHLIWTDNLLSFVTTPRAIVQVEDFLQKDATFVVEKNEDDEDILVLEGKHINRFELGGITFIVRVEE